MSPDPTKKITVPTNVARTALLVAVLVAAVAVVVPALDRSRTDGPSPGPGPTDGAAPGLERLLTSYATDVVADARYRPPDRAEREALAEGVALYVDGEHARAARRLAEVDFGVRIVRDAPRGGDGPGRRYAEIADRTEETRRGWGRVYVDLDTAPRYSVQVPHPVADAYTDRLGAGVLRGAPGGILVIAGAHRRAGDGNAADVAHRTDTVFHSVSAELVARGIPGIQVHGFADSSVPGRDLVVSTGAGTRARPQARTLAGALDDDGFRVCRAWEEKCPLEGRSNKQGRLADDEGVPFLHVEVSRAVRGDAARTARAVAAMATAVREWGTPTGN